MKQRFHLLDGRWVTAKEKTISGMAGEPMTILVFRDEFGPVNYDDVISNACYADAHHIREWSDCLADANEQSAIAFVI